MQARTRKLPGRICDASVRLSTQHPRSCNNLASVVSCASCSGLGSKAVSTRMPRQKNSARMSNHNFGNGETSMKASIITMAVGATFVLSTTAAFAQVSDKPFQENWAPSKWGKDDSAGSSNHTKSPENVKRAISMIKQYKSVTLGKYYHRDIPAVGTRKWNFVLTGTPNAGPFGENAMVYHDEYIATEIGQISTQFDGPGHIGVNTSKGMFLYNGRMYPESYERGPAG